MLQREITALFMSVKNHKFDGHFTKNYRTFEETGSKLLMDLDSFDCQKNPTKRQWRSICIAALQQLLDYIANQVHANGKVCSECELSGTKWEKRFLGNSV